MEVAELERLVPSPKEYDDFTFVARSVAEDMKRQNIRYVEMFYSPSPFMRRGLDGREIARAVRKGLHQVSGVVVQLVADLVRDYGSDAEVVVLEQLREVKSLGVIGMGIGGSEQAFPPTPFKPVCERARDWGFRTTVHAGEAAGPESVWSACRALNPDRIGHATTADGDDRLLDYLRERQMPLGLCPLSNVTNIACCTRIRA